MSITQESPDPQPENNEQQLEPTVHIPLDPAVVTCPAAAQNNTSDPSVTAQIHNYNRSPLYRIPEELLLIILEQFDLTIPADLAAIFSLARVSSLPRRLALGAFKDSHPSVAERYHHGPRFPMFDLTRGLLAGAASLDIARYLLPADMLCGGCLARSAAGLSTAGAGGEVVVSRPWEKGAVWNKCKFQGREGGWGIARDVIWLIIL
ncbi:hypothetical protein B0T21DRAFT_412290 [Apiosordaria backusii]|uniref:Uncharacterized protein n=1 Tax=Apiosordaria backusii TaxID=314023 RepID=A0AA40BKB1_9PEZI|nr:hypothetical protein B0T21DRAFT_412290 [Apiosordaria backusii]